MAVRKRKSKGAGGADAARKPAPAAEQPKARKAAAAKPASKKAQSAPAPAAVAAATETPHGAHAASAARTAMPPGYPSPYDGATPEQPVSTRFEPDTYITYEGSRIPWWVRVMWIVFWFIAVYYVVVFAWPDAQRYF